MISQDQVNQSIALTEEPRLGLPAGGPYEYVIVAPSSVQSIVGGLINWKLLRGISAVFIAIEDINASYIGADLQEKLHNFCFEINATWNTKYLLLIGSEQEIPLRYFPAD